MDSEKLINAVSLRPCLWNTMCMSYSNREIKGKEWEEVAKEMSCTVTEAKSKWKLLRDSFNREMRNVPKKRGDGTSVEFPSKWVHFKQMLFLKGVMTTSRLATENSHELHHMERNATSSDDANCDELIVVQSIQDNENHDEETIDTAFSKPPEPLEKKKRAYNKNQVRRNFLKTIEEIEKKKIDILQKESALRESEDYCFLMSLLPSLEKLPTKKKMLLKLEIQKLFFEAMFSDSFLNQSPFENSSPSSAPVISAVVQSPTPIVLNDTSSSSNYRLLINDDKRFYRIV